MRSERALRGQEELPLDLTFSDASSAPRPQASRPAEAAVPGRFRLRNDALASHGWPAGTEILIDEGRRPERGQVALVREGGRLKIGVFDRQLGRGVLRTDHGVQWLSVSARFVGVVAVVSAPLAGMPAPIAD